MAVRSEEIWNLKKRGDQSRWICGNILPGRFGKEKVVRKYLRAACSRHRDRG